MIKRYWNKPDFIKERIEKLNYRLYKYFSFEDKEPFYSIQSFESQSVHFSKPSRFNDPFDSNIAASISRTFKHSKTILKEKYEADVISEILLVTSKSNAVNDYILFWQSFCNWFGYLNGQRVYFFNVLKYLFFCKNNESDTGSNAIISLIKNDEAFYNLNNEYSVVDALISKEIVKKYLGIELTARTSVELSAQDYLGSLSSLYDLFGKSNEKYINASNALINRLKSLKKEWNKAIDDSFGVSCFCEDYNNILMWSHYSKKHTGFCVEYDVRNIFLNEYDQLFSPVVYSKKRVSVVVSNKKIRPYTDYKIDANAVYSLDAIFTKSSIWSYEKEWRKVVGAGEEKDFNSKLSITKVFLGACISPENEMMLKDIASQNNIKVIKMSLDDAYYKLLENEL